MSTNAGPNQADTSWRKTRVLVTGAQGHLGANLVHRLVAEGVEVRALIKPGDQNGALDGLSVEKFEGDIRDPQALAKAFEGCGAVFHTAALISTLDGDYQSKRTIFETNVLGTRNVLRAAREAGVKRTVVTSSFGAVGRHEQDPHEPASEDVPVNPFHRLLPYERSKSHMELEVLRAVAEGQQVVMATSCAIVGGHDYVPSRMGRVLCKFSAGKLAAYVPGGFEFVAAHDIVQGHVLAMDRGRVGQKYVISSGYQTFDHIMDVMAKVTGRKKPPLRIPAGVMYPIAKFISSALTLVAPRYPQKLTPGAIHILSMCRRADTTKARTELGFEPSSIESAIEDAYAFHVARGAITNPVRAPRTTSAEVRDTTEHSRGGKAAQVDAA